MISTSDKGSQQIQIVYLLHHRDSQNILKIAVMGMGVAGSYLMARLKDSEHDVTGYELNPKERHDSICAWGTIKPILTEYCKKTGRDFNDFLIHDGKNMHVKMNNDVKFDIGLHGLCTYDKIGLIKDFIKDSKIIYGKPPSLEELEKEYDMIVDCTGFHRVYLPKLKEDFFLPTYEYKVEYENGVPYDDFTLSHFLECQGIFGISH